ncbi:MAG: Ni/Fe-hydrogenase, b-type cytochrome subunit [Dehalobacter sp.]|nr:Ni/Fe-hydrogenase, b-type cytochrome subunit [Dehalobacter sp.]
MVKASDHPLFQRITHWINLISFAILIPTGFIIHSPAQGINMNVVRNLHFIFMYILVINGIVRLYYSFFGKHKDYKEFFLNKLDLKTFIPQIKYYLFISKEHPKTGKYNPMQKLAYIAIPFLIAFQAITGIILYLPMKFPGATEALGSLAAVRGLHYVCMWVLILFIVAHLYLVFTEAMDQLGLMFFGKTGKREKQKAGKTDQTAVKS